MNEEKLQEVQNKYNTLPIGRKNSPLVPLDTNDSIKYVVNPKIIKELGNPDLIADALEEVEETQKQRERDNARQWAHIEQVISKGRLEDPEGFEKIEKMKQNPQRGDERIIVTQDGRVLKLKFKNNQWVVKKVAQVGAEGDSSWYNFKRGYEIVKELGGGALRVSRDALLGANYLLPIAGAAFLYLSDDAREFIKNRFMRIGEQAAYDITSKIQGQLGQPKTTGQKIADMVQSAASDYSEVSKTLHLENVRKMGEDFKGYMNTARTAGNALIEMISKARQEMGSAPYENATQNEYYEHLASKDFTSFQHSILHALEAKSAPLTVQRVMHARDGPEITEIE